MNVIGELCAAALAVDGSHYFNKCWGHAASFVTSPPFREDPETKTKLMEELAAGNLDLVSSDHCGYDAETRALGQNNFTLIPQGITGVQERLGVVYQKGVVESSLPMTKFVEVTSSKAAKLLNLFPQKGHIGEGSDADIVIWSKDAGSTPSTNKGGEFNNKTCVLLYKENILCFFFMKMQ